MKRIIITSILALLCLGGTILSFVLVDLPRITDRHQVNYQVVQIEVE